MIARSGRGQSSLPCIGGERKPGVLTLALGAELHLCHCHQSRGCPSGGSQRSAQRTAEGRPGCASEQSARRCRRAKCCNGDSDNLVRCFWTCLVFLGRSTLNVRYVQDGCNLGERPNLAKPNCKCGIRERQSQIGSTQAHHLIANQNQSAQLSCATAATPGTWSLTCMILRIRFIYSAGVLEAYLMCNLLVGDTSSVFHQPKIQY